MTQVLSITDYFVQGVLVLLAFVYPWRIPLEKSPRAARMPLVATFAWGLWRMGIFDPATHNDVPGVGYIYAAFVLALIGKLSFGLRRVLIARRNKAQ